MQRCPSYWFVDHPVANIATSFNPLSSLSPVERTPAPAKPSAVLRLFTRGLRRFLGVPPIRKNAHHLPEE
jgi:hypothetical protein